MYPLQTNELQQSQQRESQSVTQLATKDELIAQHNHTITQQQTQMNTFQQDSNTLVQYAQTLEIALKEMTLQCKDNEQHYCTQLKRSNALMKTIKVLKTQLNEVEQRCESMLLSTDERADLQQNKQKLCNHDIDKDNNNNNDNQIDELTVTNEVVQCCERLNVLFMQLE